MASPASSEGNDSLFSHLWQLKCSVIGPVDGMIRWLVRVHARGREKPELSVMERTACGGGGGSVWRHRAARFSQEGLDTPFVVRVHHSRGEDRCPSEKARVSEMWCCKSSLEWFVF